MKHLFVCIGLALAAHSGSAQLKPSHQAKGQPNANFQPAKLAPIQPAVPLGTAAGLSQHFNSLDRLPQPISGTNLMAYLDSITGTPYYITGKMPVVGQTAVEKVNNFLLELGTALGLRNASEELVLTDSQTDPLGHTHYLLRQQWNGIEVFGAEVKLHEKEGRWYLFQGRYYPSPITVETEPALNAQQAIDIAVADLSRLETVREMTALEKRLTAYQGPQARLVIYHFFDDPLQSRLAWLIELVPNPAGRYSYFVDAKTGQILHFMDQICHLTHNLTHSGGGGQPSNEAVQPALPTMPPPDGPAIANAVDLHGVTRTIHTYEKSNKFYMIDASRTMFKPAQSSLPDDAVGVIITLDALNTAPGTNNFQVAHVTSSNNSWNNPKAVSAHYNAAKAYEYYKNTFGRESINGQGGNIISLINVVDTDGSQMDNAFWNGAAMFYGNGNQGYIAPLCKSLDVAGHEMTHGVIDATAKLIYQNESGALNESFADVFGAMVDRDDWRLGEEVVNPIVFPSGALRDLSNPHNGGNGLNDNGWQPAHFNERYTGSADNGGVHINSGITNRAYYLFATNSAVGKEKAEQVYYRALNQYLFKSAKFIDCRIAVIQAATDLYGASVANAAAAAFDAVGIGGGGATNSQTDIDPNPGEDFVLLTDADFSQLYLFRPNGTPVANPLSTTSPLSRPSVSDDGSVAVFVAQDQTIHALLIDWNTGQVQEQVLSNDPVWRNVAIARDKSRIAALTDDYDNRLWIYDFGLQTWGVFNLYNPTTGQGGPISSDVRYADVLEWDYTGEWVMYDALNNLPFSTGGGIEYWDISFVRVWNHATASFGDGFTDKLFNVLPENVSIGNPTFSKNSDYIIAFDYLDEYTNEYFLVGANVETGGVGTIFENQDLSWPNFSVDDSHMVFDAYDNSGNPVLAMVPLASNKITAAASPFIYINQGRRGVWFANGSRILVEAQDKGQAVAISVVPNPVTNTATLSINIPKSGMAHLLLADVNGHISVEQHWHHGGGRSSKEFSVESLPAGIYVVRLQLDDEIFTTRLVKQ